MSKRNPELALNDVADDLFILNKITIDKLFALDKPTEPLALYMFYYKTAKWQKTNRIKANDVYVRKCLKWGAAKVTSTKKKLKEMGLIKVVQSRKNNQVAKWFIEISYIVSSEKSKNTHMSVVDNDNPEQVANLKGSGKNTQTSVVGSKNTPEQEHSKARTLKRETNALKQSIKVLENKTKEVFGFWIKIFEKHEAVLDDSRIEIIGRALKNYSTADVKNAIVGCSLSDFHMGVSPASKNGIKHNSLSIILRDSEQIEKFIALSGSKSHKAKVLPSLDEVTDQLCNVYLQSQERKYTHPITGDIDYKIQEYLNDGNSFKKVEIFKEFIESKYQELSKEKVAA